MSVHKANVRRIQNARKAMTAYVAHTKTKYEGLETNFIDLLTDLRHLAEAKDIDFERVLRISGDHFNVEKKGEE